jgi:hypothetical protein
MRHNKTVESLALSGVERVDDIFENLKAISDLQVRMASRFCAVDFTSTVRAPNMTRRALAHGPAGSALHPSHACIISGL